MLLKNNKTKILEEFFKDPLIEGGFYLRELSRNTKIALPSTKKYLQELLREKLILKKINRQGHPKYYANTQEEKFVFLKKLNNINKIKESGLINYIDEKCTPDVIILFGSVSKGEDIKESDIDLFVLAKEQNLQLKKYEQILDRKISVFFTSKFNKLSPELKNNIINGTIMAGYLEVFTHELINNKSGQRKIKITHKIGKDKLTKNKRNKF